MADILAADTFQHPDQAGWPTSSGGQTWNTSARGSGTYTIASNEGVNSSNGATFCIARLGTGTAGSTEDLVRLNPADTTSDIGTIARFVDSNNFYYGILVGGVARIGKDVSNTFTTLASTSVSYANGTFYWLRFNLIGSNLKLKFWQDGSSEPSSWTVTTTDSSLSSGGYGLGSDASGSTKFDNFTVTDAATIIGVPATIALLTTITDAIAATIALKTTTTLAVSATIALKTTTTDGVPATIAIKTVNNTLAVPATIALKTVNNTLTSTASIAIKTTNTLSVPASIALKTTNTLAIPATIALKATNTLAIAATFALVRVRTIPATIALKATNAVAIPATISIENSAPSINISSNVTLYVRTNIIQLFVRKD